MTDQSLDVDAVEARAAAATDGPWRRWFSDAQKADHIRSADGMWVAQFAASDADAEFIAHAREDVPALVAEVKRLREDDQRGHLILETNRRMRKAAEAERDAALAAVERVRKLCDDWADNGNRPDDLWLDIGRADFRNRVLRALDPGAVIRPAGILPSLVDRIQYAVWQIDKAMTDTRVLGDPAAMAWLRTIKTGLASRSGFFGGVLDPGAEQDPQR